MILLPPGRKHARARRPRRCRARSRWSTIAPLLARWLGVSPPATLPRPPPPPDQPPPADLGSGSGLDLFPVGSARVADRLIRRRDRHCWRAGVGAISAMVHSASPLLQTL